MNKFINLFVALFATAFIYISKACPAITSGSRSSAGGDSSTPAPSSTPPPLGCGHPGEDDFLKQMTPGTALYRLSNAYSPWTVFVYAGSNACTGTILNQNWIITSQSCVGTTEAASITIKAGAIQPPRGGQDGSSKENSEGPEHPRSTTPGTGGETSSPTSKHGDDGGEDSHESTVSGQTHSPSTPGTTLAPSTEPPTTVSLTGDSVVLDKRYDATAASKLYDIALVKLATPLVFDPTIQPVCLPTAAACTGQKPVTGTVFASGWVQWSSPIGGNWTLYAVTGTSDANTECLVGASPAAVIGSRTSALTGLSKERIGLVATPNGADGTIFTSICCTLDFINTAIAN